MKMSKELIPGLPDCLARECLLRLPFNVLYVARNVSKKWKKEITSPSFYRLRKAAGFACPVVAVLQQLMTDFHLASTKVALFEPLTGVWTKVPAIPRRSCYRLSRCYYMAAVGYELVLIIDCENKVTKLNHEVHVYNMIAGTWRQGKSMPPSQRRYAAAYAAGPRAVFVAGGNELCHRRLNSALSYDVAADEWVRLPNMSRPPPAVYWREEGVFVDGAFRVLEFDSYQKDWRSADEFNVEEGRWKKSERKIESAICVAAAEGREYMCRDSGSMELEVLEFVGGGGGDGGAEKMLDGWRRLGVIPHDGRLIRATYMVAWEGGIMVYNRRAAYIFENGGAGAGGAAAAVEKNKWKRIEWSDGLAVKGFTYLFYPCIFQL